MALVQLTVFFIVIYVLESLIIIVQNSFVVVVLGREWMQFKRLSSVDMILISLGICRIFLQWTSLGCNFYSYANPNYALWKLGIVWEFINLTAFWLTSLLAVFYCVKVSSFTHPLFLWVKRKLLKLVPQLLLGTLILSCVSIIPLAVNYYINMQLILSDHLPRNHTLIKRYHTFRESIFDSYRLFALAIPFLLFLASTVLLIASLVQHREQMQHHESHSNSSMRAHSTALRSLTIFFIFFTSYFVTVVISYVGELFGKKSWFWVWEVVIYAVASVHSTSLMLSSPTLKRVLRKPCFG